MATRPIDTFARQNGLACAAEATFLAGTAGKKFRLVGGTLGGTVAGAYDFRDGTGGTIIFTISLAAGNAGVSFDLKDGILAAANANNLTVTGPAASAISGTVWGSLE